MFWSTISFNRLVKLCTNSFLRKPKLLSFMSAMVVPLQIIADETLYKMQHNGTKIYLEKMLNESFQVADYDNKDHEGTKLIYIDDTPDEDKLYVWQDLEAENDFMEDDGNDTVYDLFLDGDNGNTLGFSWVIYMPDSISFDEYSLRALVDSYRYIGKKYTIEIYTP